MIDDFVAKPLVPYAKPKELNKKFKVTDKLAAGKIITAVHNYLPYRMSLYALGIEDMSSVKEDPIKLEARIKLKLELTAFLEETFGREMFWNAKVEGEWDRYRYDPTGVWSFINGWLYAKEPKVLVAAKLAFAG